MSDDQKQVVPAGSTAVATSNQAGRGHGVGLTQDDFEIPRAKIVQFTSEEAQAENPADRIEPGKFINSISKAELPTEFIPITCQKSYTQWNPVDKKNANYDPAFEPGQMVFTTADRSDPRVVEGIKFGPNNETPKVTQVLTFLCHFPGSRLPMLLSFAKTSFKAGKKLNTMLEEAGGDTFSNKFRISFRLESNAGNKYYVMDVRANGKASEEEFKVCEAIYNRFAGADLEAMAHKETTAPAAE